jgi:adenylosuccinate synthase
MGDTWRVAHPIDYIPKEASMANHADIIIDLGYGDAGKGQTSDYLTHQYDGALIVRHNGGGQAAHNVVTPDGRHHCFAHFGSGMLHPAAHTLLSRFMLVEPFAMEDEARHLDALGVADVRRRTTIDPAAIIVTPFHAAANRIRETLRRDGCHGSCGIGIGEAVASSLDGERYTLRARDLSNTRDVMRTLYAIRSYLCGALLEDDAQWEARAGLSDLALLLSSDGVAGAIAERYTLFANDYQIADEGAERIRDAAHVIFEGAQGVLLDEWRGFHPHTTWSTTTGANALVLLAEAGHTGTVRKLGITRTYATRHGHGPLVTEDPSILRTRPEPHNGYGRFQGAFRAGWLDAVTLRYAVAAAGGIDGLVVTHANAPRSVTTRVCTAYRPAMGDEDFLTPGGSSIRLNPLPKDLRYQGELTAALMRCTPVYESMHCMHVNTDTSDHMRAVSGLVGVPLAIVSTGPTRRDCADYVMA